MKACTTNGEPSALRRRCLEQTRKPPKRSEDPAAVLETDEQILVSIPGRLNQIPFFQLAQMRFLPVVPSWAIEEFIPTYLFSVRLKPSNLRSDCFRDIINRIRQRPVIFNRLLASCNHP